MSQTFEVASLSTYCRQFRNHAWKEEYGSWTGEKLFRCACGAFFYPEEVTK